MQGREAVCSPRPPGNPGASGVCANARLTVGPSLLKTLLQVPHCFVRCVGLRCTPLSVASVVQCTAYAAVRGSRDSSGPAAPVPHLPLRCPPNPKPRASGLGLGVRCSRSQAMGCWWPRDTLRAVNVDTAGDSCGRAWLGDPLHVVRPGGVSLAKMMGGLHVPLSFPPTSNCTWPRGTFLKVFGRSAASFHPLRPPSARLALTRWLCDPFGLRSAFPGGTDTFWHFPCPAVNLASWDLLVGAWRPLHVSVTRLSTFAPPLLGDPSAVPGSGLLGVGLCSSPSLAAPPRHPLQDLLSWGQSRVTGPLLMVPVSPTRWHLSPACLKLAVCFLLGTSLQGCSSALFIVYAVLKYTWRKIYHHNHFKCSSGTSSTFTLLPCHYCPCLEIFCHPKWSPCPH